jgi:hypothetical protein
MATVAGVIGNSWLLLLLAIAPLAIAKGKAVSPGGLPGEAQVTFMTGGLELLTWL